MCRLFRMCRLNPRPCGDGTNFIRLYDLPNLPSNPISIVMALFFTCRPRARRARRGFTLIEAALATAIVGVGILSMVKLVAACTHGNSLARQITTATLLADHVQEAMA